MHPNGDIWVGEGKAARPIAYKVLGGWRVAGIRTPAELRAIAEMVGGYRAEFPRQQYWNRNGDPLSGGQVWYDGPVYMDADHTILHPTPIILDANGCCVVYPDGRLPVKVTDWNGIPQRV